MDVGRPEHLLVVCGTGTEVGKTWVSATLLRSLAAEGRSVSARKPVQSYDVDHLDRVLGGPTDAVVLASATGERPEDVCRRSFPRAMAPPMAADALGLANLTIAELVDDLSWPSVDVGLVETAGGVRSPQAHDGDAVDLVAALAPDLVILVADAGLGTINGVRLSMAALGDVPVAVVLNRFDPHHEIHVRNVDWLRDRDGFDVHLDVASLSAHLVRSA